MLSGAQLSVTTGLIGLGITPGLMDEEPRQILPSPYAEHKSINQWLNSAAFATAVRGQYAHGFELRPHFDCSRSRIMQML